MGDLPPAAGDWDVHWDRFGAAAGHNPANEYRFMLVRSRLAGAGSSARLLDIGSGQGELAVRLAGIFPTVEIIGLEHSETGVTRARDAAGAAGVGDRVRFFQADLLENGPVEGVPPDWATAAVCSEVLEHVDQPTVLLTNALRYAAPGCQVVVTVPAGPRTAFDRHIGHRRHFDGPALRAVLEGAGLDVRSIDRAGFPFFNLYKLMVLARGKALIGDVEHAEGGRPGGLAEMAYRFFHRAFRWNLDASPLGWQLVADAVKGG